MKNDSSEDIKDLPSDNSTLYLGTGLGLGAYVGATTLLVGTACPLCVVAAPALIATGIYQKTKKQKQETSKNDVPYVGASQANLTEKDT